MHVEEVRQHFSCLVSVYYVAVFSSQKHLLSAVKIISSLPLYLWSWGVGVLPTLFVWPSKYQSIPSP